VNDVKGIKITTPKMQSSATYRSNIPLSWSVGKRYKDPNAIISTPNHSFLPTLHLNLSILNLAQNKDV
jgi:hypothetical protein